MDWKNSLDKYLTTPPDDGFEGWAEQVVDNFSDEFYTENESWINEIDGEFNEWLNELFYSDYNIFDAVKIIDYRFKNKPNGI